MASNSAAICLCRHCKTAWNLEGRIQGMIDLLLAALVLNRQEQTSMLFVSSACTISSAAQPVEPAKQRRFTVRPCYASWITESGRQDS